MADLEQVDPNSSNKIKGSCFQKVKKCLYIFGGVEIINEQKIPDVDCRPLSALVVTPQGSPVFRSCPDKLCVRSSCS